MKWSIWKLVKVKKCDSHFRLWYTLLKIKKLPTLYKQVTLLCTLSLHTLHVTGSLLHFLVTRFMEEMSYVLFSQKVFCLCSCSLSFSLPITFTILAANIFRFLTTVLIFSCFVSNVILPQEKFLQFDWPRAVVFQLNLKYLHVKITNLLWVVV